MKAKWALPGGGGEKVFQADRLTETKSRANETAVHLKWFGMNAMNARDDVTIAKEFPILLEKSDRILICVSFNRGTCDFIPEWDPSLAPDFY